MTTYFPTGGSLYTARIDVGSAPNAWSERNNLRSCDFCINPSGYNLDQYGRNASPYTLNMIQGGTCGNLDSVNNVSSFLERENNLERPWLNPVFLQTPYDTMGVGRSFQTASAGCGGEGAWYRNPGALQAAPQQCNDVPAPRVQPFQRACNSLPASAYRVQYHG